MPKITCIKCGAIIKENFAKDATSICDNCVDKLLENMSASEILAHAKIGWDALIDEATGYDKVRPKDALNKRYKQYKNKNV